MLTLKAFAIWAAILLLAILNGALREALLVPQLGLTAGQVSSGLILSTIILVVTYLALPWLGARRSPALFAVGLGWLALTLVFEFAFGFWQGKSGQELLAAYTFRDGNLWPLVLLVTALAPRLAAKVRGWG